MRIIKEMAKENTNLECHNPYENSGGKIDEGNDKPNDSPD
jgi:hypothetical protein